MALTEFNHDLPSHHEGCQIRLRHKATAEAQGTPVLFVHGATYGATQTFDYAIDGRSWMDEMADQGFDAWCLDLTGYGQSDRPGAMAEPANLNAPLVQTDDAVVDVQRAIEFICAQCTHDAVDLLGYSWGTAICGRVAGQFPERVNRLILYGALWVEKQADFKASSSIPAYRTVTAHGALSRWAHGLDPVEFETVVAPTVAADWCQTMVETDPNYDAAKHAFLRAPTGVRADFAHCAQTGIDWYQPELIQAPTLIVVGDLDIETTPEQGLIVFSRLTQAHSRQFTLIGGGTHSLLLENRRFQLVNAVHQFLNA
jgi:pimeloyl-ACP methyl ester carboxylesterase